MSVNDPGTSPVDVEYVLEALERGLRDTPHLTDIESWITKEVDWRGEHANLAFPLCEIQPVSRIPLSDGKQFVRFIEDSNGNEVGEIYELARRLRVQVTIFTIGDSEDNHMDLGDRLELALFKYAEAGYDQPLPDPDGAGISDVEVEPDSASQLGTSQYSGGSIFVRGWRHDVFLPYSKRVSTYEEFGELPYVTDVNTPGPDDIEDDPDVEDGLESVPPYD